MTNQLDFHSQRMADSALPVSTPHWSEPVQSLTDGLVRLLSSDHHNPSIPSVLNQVQGPLTERVLEGFKAQAPGALLEFHKALFLIYETAFTNPLSKAAQHQHSPWLVAVRHRLESLWCAWEEREAHPLQPSEAIARHPRKLMEWVRELALSHNRCDKEVANFLAFKADIQQIKQFILTEAPLNFRFYDTLVQVSPFYSEPVKTEISRNLWDECGAGRDGQAHTILFSQVLEELGVETPRVPIWTDWQPYAGYNLHFLLGSQRRYYFRALGCLAMPELFAPEREAAVSHGMERLGFNLKKDMNFYHVHQVMDVDHGADWLKNIIGSVVEGQPEAGRELALGAIMRMNAFHRYNAYLAGLFGLQ